MAGIEPIPKADRNLGGLDFFVLWAGAAVSLAEIWAGGLIVPLGLTLGARSFFSVTSLGIHPWLWEA